MELRTRADPSLRGAVDFADQRPLSDSAFVLWAHARLDNRGSLLDKLSGDGIGREQTDNELIAAAFRKWGRRCPEHLSGDWAFAAWDPKSQALLLARDHFGNTGLHYARTQGGVVFASDLSVVVDSPGVAPRLDMESLAWFLLVADYHSPSDTVYAGVHRVPPGHAVLLSADQSEQWRYWTLSTPIRESHHADDLADRIVAAVRRAVERRCQGSPHVAIALSSGLDSSAVTAFAAPACFRTGSRITALTSVPLFPDPERRTTRRTKNEGPLAAQLCAALAIPHAQLSARTARPVAAVAAMQQILREPQAGAVGAFWILDLLSEVRAIGADRLLTGQTGDFVLAGRRSTRTMAQLIAAGNWKAAVRRAAPYPVLALRDCGWRPWRLRQPPWLSYSLIHPDFARATAVVERLAATGQDVRFLKASPNDPHQLAYQAARPVGAYWASLGRAYGVPVYDPFQDRLLMELMYGVEPPNGGWPANRWLFRQAMEGHLPARVLSTTTKARQSADIVQRLRTTASDAEQVFASALRSPLASGVVDISRCRAALARITSGHHPGARRDAEQLLLALSVLILIVGFEGWPGVDG